MSHIVKEKNLSIGPVEVLLVFPKALTGRLMVEALNHERDIHVSAHVSSPEAVRAFTRHADIHIALISLNLAASRDGLDVLRTLRHEHCKIRSIMLMETSDQANVVESFRLGAKAVFSMASSGYDLLSRCIRAVHQGQIWANVQEIHWVMEALQNVEFNSGSSSMARNEKILQFEKLSKREVDVVNLLAEGLSNRDIARSLNLSENTIKNYLFRIFEKVGVSSRTELLLQAYRLSPRDKAPNRNEPSDGTPEDVSE